MPRGTPKQTVPLPDLWKDDFRSATMRTNFMLALSQSMIEFLSSVADGVQWDRSLFNSIHKPDNWVATGGALTKRGLIRRKCREASNRHFDKLRTAKSGDPEWDEWNYWELTPAGRAVVNLLKVTGIFVEADSAIRKKVRRSR